MAFRYDSPFDPGKSVLALCSDGKERMAQITSYPDTFFSIPARVRVGGKTVSGFISRGERLNGDEMHTFTSYKYRKNGDLLPGVALDERRASWKVETEAMLAECQRARDAEGGNQ